MSVPSRVLCQVAITLNHEIISLRICLRIHSVWRNSQRLCAKTAKAKFKCCLGQDNARPLLRNYLSCSRHSTACTKILSGITIKCAAGLCPQQSLQHPKCLPVLSTEKIIRTVNQGILMRTFELTSACPKRKNVEQLHKHGAVEMVTTNCSLALTAQWQFL